MAPKTVAPTGPITEVTACRQERRRSRRRIALMVLGGMAAVAFAGVALLAAVAPEQAERVYGDATQALHRTVDDGVQAVTGTTVRSVILGVDGGAAQMNRCDGTFTHMVGYTSPGVAIPPVWAAHNKCGGDVILSWNVGDEATATHGPTRTLYRVVEIRYAPKHGDGADVTALNGISGDLVLQSCLYGSPLMKFVGLAPITQEAHQ